MLGDVLKLFREGRLNEMDTMLAALAEKEAAGTAAPAPAPVAHGEDKPEFPFEVGTDYRVHFKNGCSGEYSGAALAQRFPFDPEQVESVERIERAGEAV